MKKRLFSALLLLVLLSCCSGFSSCRGPRYTEGEKEDISSKGSAQMQEWLDEHIPKARVSSAGVNIRMIPSGPHYLTDFVSGTFTEDNQTEFYLIDTQSGAVYLEADPELFREVCRDYVLTSFELSGEKESCSFSAFDAGLSFREDWTMSEPEIQSPELMLPGKLVLELNASSSPRKLLGQYVEAPEERDLIRIYGIASVPEDLNLETRDMAWFTKRESISGLYLDSLTLSNQTETVSRYGRFVSYDRYGFAKLKEPDIRIRLKEEYRVEEAQKEGIAVTEEKESRLSDLSFQQTTEGWLVRFKDRESIFPFSIYAEGDSAFLAHEYLSREDRLAYLSPGSVITGERYVDHELHWMPTPEGDYVLADDQGNPVSFFGGEELIPRT